MNRVACFTRRSLLQWLGWLAIGILSASTAFLLIYSRVVQVITFVAASGVRRVFARATPAPVGTFIVSGPTANEARPHRRKHGNGLLTYHPSYHRFDTTKVRCALEAAAETGTTFLRSDINWCDIMPSSGVIQRASMEWYASFFAEVSNIFDMVPLVVLSNPSGDVLKAPSDERLDLWKQYISIVVEAVGLNCKHYQLLNEPNNPVYRIFSRRDTAIAIEGAASIIRERVAGARLSINVIVELVGWRKAVTDLLLAAPRCIDIVGLDLYPDTWRIGMNGGFDDLWDLQQSINFLPYTSPFRSVQLAIMETGYSTNIPWVRSGAAQASFFSNVQSHAEKLRTLEYVGVYELADQDSRVVLDPEAHFGLINSGFRRKPAFDQVRRLFQQLNSLRV